jgi:hypothetical protein
MRSPEEIRFRLRQELANVWLWARPPVERAITAAPLRSFADPKQAVEAVKNTAWARDAIALADRILDGHLPLLGAEVETGPAVSWRRDYEHGIETPAIYFRRIPYLDVARAGDHKLIWEMSRHQHLVLVAQVFLITGEKRYQDYVFHQLEHWWKENPFQRGINWASALEIAFRALSWIWIHHFIGPNMTAAFRDRFFTELARHGHHLEYNLSIYFSPNTHVLGEAVVLHALGALFPQFSRAGKWREIGRSVVLQELDKQMQQDGSHFEHSTYYHVYAVDFFNLHHRIEPLPASAELKLRAMAEFLAAITGPSGMLSFLGDDDGGRLFHPFGPRNAFARATLATCSVLLDREYLSYTREDLFDQALWWIGPEVLNQEPSKAAPQESTLFSTSGIVAMQGGATHVLVDAGRFGWANAGHSHADTLSIVIRHGTQEVLIDPGTYTYVGDIRERDAFRGTAAHNTVRIDRRDQADPSGPFRWLNKPEVEVLAWRPSAQQDYLHAACSYRGLRHQRQVWFQKPDLLVVLDTLEGEGDHEFEQFWHAGADVARLGEKHWRIGEVAELAVNSDHGEGSVISGWRADALGSKRPAPVICFTGKGRFPVRLATCIRLGGGAAPIPLMHPTGVVVDGVIYSDSK